MVLATLLLFFVSCASSSPELVEKQGNEDSVLTSIEPVSVEVLPTETVTDNEETPTQPVVKEETNPETVPSVEAGKLDNPTVTKIAIPPEIVSGEKPSDSTSEVVSESLSDPEKKSDKVVLEEVHEKSSQLAESSRTSPGPSLEGALVEKSESGIGIEPFSSDFSQPNPFSVSEASLILPEVPNETNEDVAMQSTEEPTSPEENYEIASDKEVQTVFYPGETSLVLTSAETVVVEPNTVPEEKASVTMSVTPDNEMMEGLAETNLPSNPETVSALTENLVESPVLQPETSEAKTMDTMEEAIPSAIDDLALAHFQEIEPQGISEDHGQGEEKQPKEVMVTEMKERPSALEVLEETKTEEIPVEQQKLAPLSSLQVSPVPVVDEPVLEDTLIGSGEKPVLIEEPATAFPSTIVEPSIPEEPATAFSSTIVEPSIPEEPSVEEVEELIPERKELFQEKEIPEERVIQEEIQGGAITQGGEEIQEKEDNYQSVVQTIVSAEEGEEEADKSSGVIVIVISFVLAIGLIFFLLFRKRLSSISAESTGEVIPDFLPDQEENSIPMSFPCENKGGSEKALVVNEYFSIGKNQMSCSVRIPQAVDCGFTEGKDLISESDDMYQILLFSRFIKEIENRVFETYVRKQLKAKYHSIDWNFWISCEKSLIPKIQTAFCLKNLASDEILFYSSLEKLEKDLAKIDFSRFEFDGSETETHE